MSRHRPRTPRRKKAATHLAEARERHPSLKITGRATNLDSKLNIRCPEHGPFTQSLRQLRIATTPCPKCRNQAATLTTAEFVKRAKAKFGSRFDYSQTHYVNGQTRVTIRCPKHGPFQQFPHTHLRGGGGCSGCKVGRLSTDEFISRSKELFPGRYTYARTEFRTLAEPVTITCRKHGDFAQLGSSHFASHEGCPRCQELNRNPLGKSSLSARSRSAGSELLKKRLTQTEFLKRSREVHGRRYSYTRANYRTQYDPVLVTCRMHGDFPVRPSNLWKGSGCPECARAEKGKSIRLSPKEFTARARMVHGQRYDLSQLNYTTAKSRVTPSCRTHGEWSVLPQNFLKGTGCPACAKSERQRSLNQSSRIKNITQLFKAVHSDTYDYSQVRYSRIDTPVTIICPKHGSFQQRPLNHLQGKGCHRCGAERRRAGLLLSQDEVIKRFHEEHGDLFDYSEFTYRDFKTKSTIVCREHGPFQMNAQGHLEGKGCPACSETKGERQVARWLTENGVAFLRQFSVKLRKTDNARYHVRFDFLLPSERTLIEYDGEQHFRAIAFFGMAKRTASHIFADTVRRDKAKNRWAATNRYSLIRIKYDEEVGASLDRELGHLKRPPKPE